METKPIAWSHSALSNFQTCPKQYHEVRVLKNYPQHESEALRWGNEVHKRLERSLVSGVSPTGNYAAYADVVRRFRKTKGILATEQQLAITNNFKPTGWFAADVWCRGILDAMWIDRSIARIVDWKTGRRKLDPQQLQLFALLAFAHYEEITNITAAFVWLQNGAMDVMKFKREDVPFMWQEILPQVRRLEQAYIHDSWVPKPSGLCKGWCPVKTCSFWNGAKMEAMKAQQGIVI